MIRRINFKAGGWGPEGALAAADGLVDGRYVFHSFDTDQAPFDQVLVRKVSTDGVPLGGGDVVSCPIDGAAFRLRVFRGEVSGQLIDDVVVQA
jgi:hypothetical protein